VTAIGALCALVVTSLAFAVSGCAPKPEPKPEPAVAPPAIKTAGVLRAGIDLSTPPFAGTEKVAPDAKEPPRKAGIDVDVASALAEKLGLTVQFVNVKPSDAATALASGRVDVVLSVPFAGTDSVDITVAGTYIDDAPALFVSTGSTASVESSLTLATLNAYPVAAQTGSPAYWTLVNEYGAENVTAFDTLRAALEDISTGGSPYAAGDALVGAYIARDMPGVHIAGQVGPADPLGIACVADNEKLVDAVRNALDSLAADGVLDQIARKWVGNLPRFESASAETTPAQ
jgi:ABC-type amino acid transport substrate-binding protein